MNKLTIAVDFDGTCVVHSFPHLGEDIGAVPVLKDLVEQGHQLILFTMRCDNQPSQLMDNGYQIHGGDFLTQAVNWFKDNDIALYGIQSNPTQSRWTSSPKCYAQLIIDDTGLGCPLKYDKELSDRPFVDWVKVRELLVEQKILKV